MSDFRTPGVYVEEISTFPTSVVRVATAVPVFVGYTERADASVLNWPTKIKSLVDYEQLYGGEPTSSGRRITAHIDDVGNVNSIDLALEFYLYNSLRHFYANGGGDAYILSVGTYADGLDQSKLTDGIDILKKVDEPTLILVPDAYSLGEMLLGQVQMQVLSHCAAMQDRFGIFDVITTDPVADEGTDAGHFRNRIGMNNLKYGAAYYPVLHTTIGPNGPISGGSFSVAGTTLELAAGPSKGNDAVLLDYAKATSDMGELSDGITIGIVTKSFSGWYDATLATITSAANPGTTVGTLRSNLTDTITRMNAMAKSLYDLNGVTLKIAAADTTKNTLVNKVTVGGLKTYLEELFRVDFGYSQLDPVYAPTITGTFLAPGKVPAADYEVVSFEYSLASIVSMTVPEVQNIYGIAPATEKAAIQNALANLGTPTTGLLARMKASYDALTVLVTRSFDDVVKTSRIMAGIVSSIRGTGYTLPPSGAIAGIYASVDASRGVWKAPANVSLAGVASVDKMRDDQLDHLNIDETAGKSINAIRFFRGQGILVYGARTLAGNDNEWRYVPVRRLFIMVEESVRKASEPFVFEPNDGNTWQRIKAMIENFLLGIWRDGGLAGAVPKDAFFVKVGLGQTMTAQDILEGKLIIEIGMAAVRPAEFVILRFSHKMQES